MKSRSGKPLAQRSDELRQFIRVLNKHKVTRFLEIGSRFGDTLWEVAMGLPEGSKVVALDLPNGPWGREDSEMHLTHCINALKDKGYDARMILGDSTTLATRMQVERAGPYDAILIDGDHRFEGCVLDWINYGPMARIIAFHDIDGWQHFEGKSGDPVDVPFVWSALKRKHKYIEIVGRNRGMGIGVIFREVA